MSFGFGFGIGSTASRNAFDRLPWRMRYDPNVSVTTVSGNVSVLPDLTGNGNDLVQATAGNRPSLTTLGGRVAVLSASSKWLQCATISGGGLAQACTYMVAGTYTTTGLTLLFDGAGASNRQGFAANGSGAPCLTHGSASGTPGTVISGGTPFVGAFIFGASDTDSRMILRPNGAAAQDLTVDPDGSAQTLTGLTLGGTYVFSNFWTGAIATFAGMPGVPSESALQAALTSLQLRYGIVTA